MDPFFIRRPFRWRIAGFQSIKGIPGHHLLNALLKNAYRLSIDSIQDLLGSAERLSTGVAAAMREGLAESLQLVFWSVVLLAVITLAAVWRIPELEKEERPGS